MLLWSLKLTVMCITSTVAQSCSKIIFFLHWLASLIALVSFSAVTFAPSPPPLSAVFCPPWTYSTNNFLDVLWTLGFSAVLFFLFFFIALYWRKKFEKVAFNFPRMLTIIYVCKPFFYHFSCFSSILIISHFYVLTSNICSICQSEEFHCFILWSEILYMS